MGNKIISLATFLIMSAAASPCLGVPTGLGNTAEAMRALQDDLDSAVGPVARASSGHGPAFATLMPFEQPTATIFIHHLYSNGTSSSTATSVPIFYYDEVNRAALCDEDHARIKAGESVKKVVGAAIRRFAREHDVPQEMASSFSVAMGKKDKKEALLECICFCVLTRSYETINKAFADRSASFLTQLLKHLSWIGCDNTHEVKQNKRFFVKKIEGGMDFDGAATLLLTSKFSVPGEAPEDPTLEPLIQSLPVHVRLGASSLEKTPSFMKRVLAWVGSQDEERALASLSFLTKCENERQGSAFMAISPALSPSYINMFVHYWPLRLDFYELTLILGQGDLTKKQLKGLTSPKDRMAIYETQWRLMDSLFARLIALIR